MGRNRIEYDDWVFENRAVRGGTAHLACSLTSTVLEANTFSPLVECENPEILNFVRNTPLTYSFGKKLVGVFYVQNVKREGENLYRIYATSAVGRLSENDHYGGLYTGETVGELLPEIFRGIPYAVKTSLLDIKLYGWLPKATARDNLVQVLIAIGGCVKSDADGVVRIENLWDGISGEITGGRMFPGTTVEQETEVAEVQVTEHKYAPGTEEKQLFEGNTKQGDVITFGEPMHSLVATGFAILESGANYAKVTAGAGVLSGKCYTHTTLQISEKVWEARSGTEKVEQVEDATLISMANSADVAEHLGNYFRCSQTISASVAYAGEHPGDVVQVYHPWNKTMVPACVESIDLSLSASTLEAQEVLRLGYVPTQTGQYKIVEHTEVLSGSGEWIAPEGVERVRAIIVSGGAGGAGGYAGVKGGDSEGRSFDPVYDGRTTSYTFGMRGGSGGNGGQAGMGGTGGRAYEVDVAVTSGEKYLYVCGSGGAGGKGGTTDSDPGMGEEGEASLFAGHSSETGTIPEEEVKDYVTGCTYSKKGDMGTAGGKGSSYDKDTTYDSDETRYYVVTTGPQLAEWFPGMDKNIVNIKRSGNCWAGYVGGAGGGAAFGSNGGDGRGGSAYVNYVSSTNVLQVRTSGGDGGNGANAILGVAMAVGIGTGGIGGNGGGGGGGAGAVQYGYHLGSSDTAPTMSGNTYTSKGVGGAGGNGSEGGQGSPGGIILHWSERVPVSAGMAITCTKQVRLDSKKRLLIV